MKLMEVVEKPGGYAMKDVNVVRIKKTNIPATIQHVSELSGIPKKDLHPLGSTGKTKTSGDIDLGVEITKYDIDDIHQRMCSRLGNEYCSFNQGTKVASYAVPIMRRGKEGIQPTGEKVQVDFMFVRNLKWAQFSYHSEGTSGKPTLYKGAIRNILLKSIAATIQEEGVDRFFYDPADGDLVIRIGRTLDLNKGLRRIFQIRPERKNASKGQSHYLKNMTTIKSTKDVEPALNALKKRYPADFDSVSFDVNDRELTIDDPADFLKIMFPGRPKVSEKDVNTAEDIIRLIKSRFDPERQKEIFEKSKHGTRYLSTKMRVPDWDNILNSSDPEGNI